MESYKCDMANSKNSPRRKYEIDQNQSYEKNPISQNLIPNKNGKSPPHCHCPPHVPPPTPSRPCRSPRLNLRIRNPSLLIPLQQLLPLRHRGRPDRIQNRRSSRRDELQPKQRRPAEARDEEFETLRGVCDLGAGPEVWDGGGGTAECAGKVES